MCCLLCVQLLEEATKRNDEWEAQFLRQGQTLVADSAAPSLSLEAELENVSKDEVNAHTPVYQEFILQLGCRMEHLGGKIVGYVRKKCGLCH